MRELFSLARRKYHREVWALRDFNMTVETGECIGLVGLNGAGKSTALKIVAGKLHPTTGRVEVNGRLSSILELGTGFQPNLTGRQNAFVNGLFMGLRPWEAKRHVDKMLDFAELGEYGDQPLSTYSSGMQARLAFASLVTLDPEILILDEALATGDARFAAKGQDYIRKLCRSGCTTLVASHDFAFLRNVCDRIVMLEKGRKKLESAPGPAVQHYLESLNQEVLAGSRPRNVVLKIEAVDPSKNPTFAIHGIQWEDEQKIPLSHLSVGEEQGWGILLGAAADCGFTPVGALGGWGKKNMIEGLHVRECTPGAAGGASYVAIPVPLPPIRVPTQIVVILFGGASCDAIFSLQIDGRSVEIGRGGRGQPGSVSIIKFATQNLLEPGSMKASES